MINLLDIQSLNLTENKVIVRADLDISENPQDLKRLEVLLPLLKDLIERNCRIVLIGHRGRPEGKLVDYLSMRTVSEKLTGLVNTKVIFSPNIADDEALNSSSRLLGSEILMLENLRFDPREENNDAEFVQILAKMGNVYINEAFAVSHRNHASLVGLPKLLPHAAGPHFISEVNHLTQVSEEPKRPVVVIIGGAKEDKLSYVEDFKRFADRIIVVGRLPEYLGDDYADSKVFVSKLIPDKEDITIHSIETIEEEVAKAQTILLVGPVGKYEEEGHRMGTKRVFEAVVRSSAYKIAGGGDTEKAINELAISGKFDWISVGGGAALEFLAKGTLPGIEALLA